MRKCMIWLCTLRWKLFFLQTDTLLSTGVSQCPLRTAEPQGKCSPSHDQKSYLDPVSSTKISTNIETIWILSTQSIYVQILRRRCCLQLRSESSAAIIAGWLLSSDDVTQQPSPPPADPSLIIIVSIVISTTIFSKWFPSSDICQHSPITLYSDVLLLDTFFLTSELILILWRIFSPFLFKPWSEFWRSKNTCK